MTRLTRYCLDVAVRGAPLLLVAALTCSCSARGGSVRAQSISTSSVTSAGPVTGATAISLVSCSGSRCSVTMGGPGTTVTVLDTTIAFGHVSAGTATVRVAGQDVSCTSGQTVPAGPLLLACTEVTADTVSFTASRR